MFFASKLLFNAMRAEDKLNSGEISAILDHFGRSDALAEFPKKSTVGDIIRKLSLDEETVCNVANSIRLDRMMSKSVMRGPRVIMLGAFAVLFIGLLFAALMISAGAGPGTVQKTKGSSTALPTGDPNIIRVQP